MTPLQKSNSIVERHKKRFDELLREAHKLAELPRNLDHLGQRMRLIASELTGFVAPMSPCKKNCNHCCHMATMISSWEAEQIAEFTGRKIQKIKGYEIGQREELIDRYSGNPCPFLSDGICSIYQVRPFACMMHFSMANDAHSCDIIAKPNETVPYFNFRKLEFAIARLWINKNCKLGDIREFFD